MKRAAQSERGSNRWGAVRKRGAALLIGRLGKQDGRKRMAQEGTVKWFSDEKGYGFISPDDGGEDLFVQNSGTEGGGFKTLDRGNRVTFEKTQGKKGMQAVNVNPASNRSAQSHAGRAARPAFLSPLS
jgi:CspA family cold shock protein